jgi:hypothetical protein
LSLSTCTVDEMCLAWANDGSNAWLFTGLKPTLILLVLWQPSMLCQSLDRRTCTL